MKFLLIYFIPFLFNCNCIYKGSYSKVVWDEQKEYFTQTSMELGEINIFIDFSFCKKGKNKLVLKGRINNSDTLIGNKDTLGFETEVIRCDEYGKIIENIVTINNVGNFSFETQRDKKGFLIFKEKNKNYGYRYNINEFN